MIDKLATEVILGKKGAATLFYKTFVISIRKMIQSKVNDEAEVEELVQDTFLSAFDSLAMYRGEATLKTWLYAIARHEIADYYRKRYVRKIVEKTKILFDENLGITTNETPEIIMDRVELAHKMDKTLRKLTTRYRKVIKLRYQMGMTVKEVAKEMKISFKATESLLFRAKSAFGLLYEN